MYTVLWEQCKLGDIVKWSKGNDLAKSVLNETKSGEDVIHYADLYKFNPVVTNVIHWSESGQGTIIPENSLLFPMSDVTPVGLARTSTILKTGVKAGGDTLIGTISIEQIAEFISYQINAIPGKILPLVTGTTVRHISAGALSTLEVMIPTKSEQRKISDFFNNLENLITLQQRKLELLKQLKQGFLQQMFPQNKKAAPKVRFADFD
ncbi:restriction endonuclease subunit S, partial [Liquorilactobacillus satsumensis]